MYKRFHQRFGTAGVVLGVIALILALGGSALAASGLNGKQKKEVKSIAKSFQGTGPAGAPGAAGTNGTNGKDGTNGTNGADGTGAEAAIFAGAKGSCSEGGVEVKSASPAANVCNGVKGTNGTNGKSVTLTTEPEGANCLAGTGGGTKVEVEGNAASKKYVCNGKEGSPWTAGGTLPSGSTETGSWALAATASPGEAMPISFPIPLAAELDGVHGKYVPKGGTPPAECENGAHAGTAGPKNPEATNGYLCVYAAGGEVESDQLFIYKPGSEAEPGFSTTGALLVEVTKVIGGPFGAATGTWAITAP